MKETIKKGNFTILVLTLMFVLTVTSCGGDESDDPKPQKTELELLKEAIVGTSWQFQSAVVIANGNTYNYSGNCDFSMFSNLGSSANLTATNVNDTDYSFTSLTSLNWSWNCSEASGNSNYTLTKEGDSYLVKYNQGGSNVTFEILSNASTVETGTVIVKRIAPLSGLATSSTITFTSL